ncbi:F-box/FBD/LRR-repeat protein At5g56420 isoform X2 [Gossypium hirsutum]|uniref:F-box/FBD/LRR-repeat protein At5g56420 isoform X2 n=1 Tax=Gossypium hirsutum TaxID=3635 RepID=A0ABM3ABU1_GOSHI|nr:F-box/FBD/LRR-repeat protein At5g56420 isoform X2 [Gossypium hirsutum]
MEKGDQGKEDFRDRISELTDEILFIILSFLTLKEVANICFLSRRLKILWPLIVALNFDASNTLGELRRNGRLRKKKRTWYINWVNHVLESHKGSTLNEFRVCFDLDWTCRHDIDSWFCFAISKRVRKLELDFEEVAEETWPPGGNLDDEPAFAFCPLSGYLCQLKTLTLEMSAYNMTFPNFPEVTNLKHLAVSA